ncbi:hypothetical protein ACFP3Q_11385 [Nocardioides sp. GCM10027113]|uniref:hypothetical protein n=1 Tax=unclassified Nocardioides TaxID=2615069 RepID=UPI003606D7C8
MNVIAQLIERDTEVLDAVRATLARCGYSYPELEEQSRTDTFETPQARLAWSAIQGLRP